MATRIGDIPSFKLFESDKILAFLDIQPLSKGHAVRLPSRVCCDSFDLTDTLLALLARHTETPRRQTDRHPGRCADRDPPGREEAGRGHGRRELQRAAEQRESGTPRGRPRPFPHHPEAQRDRGPGDRLARGKDRL